MAGLVTTGLAFASAVVNTQGTAQQSSLRAQQTIDWQTGRAFNLPVTVGPVKFTSVEFTDLGKGYGRGGIGSRIRSAVGGSEASTTLRAHFLAENPTADEWDVTITLELLDRGGKVIEKVARRPSWEGEAKPYDFDLEILEYVVPSIARARLTFEARVG
jgi:hypothetical protein